MPHIHEKIDFCSEVFIVYKDKILLRKHDKYKIWMSAGGHIELDEDPVEAAMREVKEEVGLDVKIIDSNFESLLKDLNDKDIKSLPIPRYLYRHVVNEAGHEHIVFVYFAKSESCAYADSVLDHEKGVEVNWFSLVDLEKLELTQHVKFYAKKALEELGEK